MSVDINALPPAGLTPQQQELFRRGECTGPEHHKWTGPNYPTTEGRCPFCVDPEVVQAFQAVQIEMLTKEALIPVRPQVDIPPVAPFIVPPPIAEQIEHGSEKQPGQISVRERLWRAIHWLG